MKANHGRYGQVELVSQTTDNVYMIISTGEKHMLNKVLASKFSPLTDENENPIDLFNLDLPENSTIAYVKAGSCDEKKVKKNSIVRQGASNSEERYINGYCKVRK